MRKVKLFEYDLVNFTNAGEEGSPSPLMSLSLKMLSAMEEKQTHDVFLNTSILCDSGWILVFPLFHCHEQSCPWPKMIQSPLSTKTHNKCGSTTNAQSKMEVTQLSCDCWDRQENKYYKHCVKED